MCLPSARFVIFVCFVGKKSLGFASGTHAPLCLLPTLTLQRITRLRQGYGEAWRKRSLIAQFDVPVSEIDKVFPEIVLRCGKSDLDERTPLGPFRFADQTHVRLAR